jgi:hypothetical protein
MADYDCWPLWHDGARNGDVGDIDPLSLPIDPPFKLACLSGRMPTARFWIVTALLV